MNCAEATYPPRDWVPVDLADGDANAASLGFTPRALRANSDGTIVARFIETPASAPDRVLGVRHGEVLSGFVKVIKAESTAAMSAAK